MNGSANEKTFYRKYINELNKVQALCTKMYFKTELKTRSGNPQKIWELIKTTLPSP